MSWQTELIKRYPLLFRSELTGHAAGYPTVGDGWQLAVETAIARIDAAVGALLTDGGAVVHIGQIKEKLGRLRVYAEWTALPPAVAEKVQEAIDLAEARASSTCEVCGAPGRLYDRAGWYLTRCERHAEGEPVPDDDDEDLHVQFAVVDGKMRVLRCRRYDYERDAFTDAPLPPGDEWAEEN